jgi:hypothetical protein
MFSKVTSTSLTEDEDSLNIDKHTIYSLIDLSSLSAGIDIPDDTMTALAADVEDLASFYVHLFTHFPDMRRNPCDFLDQRNRSSGLSILSCSNTLEACYTKSCVNSGECSDGNECNGIEICNDTSSICEFPTVVSCPNNTVCDNNTFICQECTKDEDCNPTNPCDGIGLCLPKTNQETKLACTIIKRCNSIIETCDPDTNVTAVLERYGYTLSTMPPVPEDKRLAIGRNDDTYDAPDAAPTDHLPEEFDWRRVYCRSHYCQSGYDCPLGTLCKIYSPNDFTKKKCKYCLSDADCQDGITCNGQERCHPEGTCRRSKLTLCQQYRLRTDPSIPLKNYTCIESHGRCYINNGTNVAASRISTMATTRHRDRSKGPMLDVKNVGAQATANVRIASTVSVADTSTPTPPTPLVIALSITIPVVVLVVLLVLFLYLSVNLSPAYHRNHKKHKKKKYT